MRLLFFILLFPAIHFGQLSGKAFIQLDTLRADDGQILNYAVKGYLFTSDSTCRSFNYSRDNSNMDISFNDQTSLKKNIQTLIRTYSVERFQSIEQYSFILEKLDHHLLIRFESGISFNPFLPSDVVVLNGQALEIYEGEEDCEHCYHAQDRNLYFFLYEDLKLSKKYRKMIANN